MEPVEVEPLIQAEAEAVEGAVYREAMAVQVS